MHLRHAVTTLHLQNMMSWKKTDIQQVCLKNTKSVKNIYIDLEKSLLKYGLFFYLNDANQIFRKFLFPKYFLSQDILFCMLCLKQHNYEVYGSCNSNILCIGFSQQGYEVNADELTPLIERHGFDVLIPDYLSPEFCQFLEQQLAIFLGTNVISSVSECKESYLYLVETCRFFR